MRAVEFHELRDRLSEFVRLAKNGESVLVTFRGTVVAELGPPGRFSSEGSAPVLEALVRLGNVTLGAPNRADLYSGQPPLSAEGVAAKLLDAERADR